MSRKNLSTTGPINDDFHIHFLIFDENLSLDFYSFHGGLATPPLPRRGGPAQVGDGSKARVLWGPRPTPWGMIGSSRDGGKILFFTLFFPDFWPIFGKIGQNWP